MPLEQRVLIDHLPAGYLGVPDGSEKIAAMRGGATGYLLTDDLQTLARNYANSVMGQIVTDFSGGTVSAGLSNNFTVLSARPLVALVDGFSIAFTANRANTGAATLEVFAPLSIIAKALKKDGGSALVANDIVANAIYQATYDSSTDVFYLREGNAIAGLAPLSGAALVNPTTSDVADGDNTGKVANTKFVQRALALLLNGVSVAYDTLAELATGKADLNSPALTGSPTAPTQSAGDNSTKISTTAYSDAAAATAGGVAPAAGLLSRSSATALLFAPKRGDKFKLNSALVSIPAAGISAGNTGVFVNGVAGQNLAANTIYWVYLFSNSGTPTFDYCTISRVISGTTGNIGVEIKSGDDTRSFIGVIKTDGSSQFVDTSTKRFVASWFNRPRRSLVGAVASASGLTTAGSWFEASSVSRAEAVFLAEEVADLRGDGGSLVQTAGALNTAYLSLGLDGPAAMITPSPGSYCPNLNVQFSVGGIAANYAPGADSYHYFTIIYLLNGGTFSVNAAVGGMIQ